MSAPTAPTTDDTLAEPDDEGLINDPGNEDPGSIEIDALVPLIEDEPGIPAPAPKH